MSVDIVLHPISFGLFVTYHKVQGEHFIDLMIPFFIITFNWR